MRLQRRQRILLYKISALLSLVRWYNIFFLALSQYLAVVFILRQPSEWKAILIDPSIHLIVFASLFSVAGGYLINNFYDLEKDIINRPGKTFYEKLIKTSTALRLYFLFNVIAVMLAWLVSFNVFLFFGGFIFSLWFYSHKLKRITFIGNMMAAMLSITPFFALFLYYHLENTLILIYVCFILLLIFIREIIKDLEALKGDLIVGYHTLPVTLGVRRTKVIILGLALIGTVPAIAIFLITDFSGISYYLFAGGVGVYGSLALLLRAKEHRHFVRLNHLYRGLIIAGVFSLILFAAP